jgi:hypothetical protein
LENAEVKMSKKILIGLAIALTVAVGIGIGTYLVKHKPLSATLFGEEGYIRLTNEEARKSLQLIPVLPGKNVVNSNASPGDPKIVNEVQEINRINNENGK